MLDSRPVRGDEKGRDMTADQQGGTDTRDMLGVHGALLRALTDAPAQLAGAPDGDLARGEQLGSYLEEVLWLLHAHHVGEDELLYPKLVERRPDTRSLCSLMDEQHSAIGSSLEAAELAAGHYARSGSAGDAAALGAACSALAAVLDPHLSQEERDVLPIAAVTVSEEEWGALPGHALGSYSGERIWLPFGLVLEAMQPDVRETTLAHVAPPLQAMWANVGMAAFNAEMASIRGIA